MLIALSKRTHLQVDKTQRELNRSILFKLSTQRENLDIVRQKYCNRIMGVTICLPCAETSGIKILKLDFVLENLYCNPPPRAVHLKKCLH